MNHYATSTATTSRRIALGVVTILAALSVTEAFRAATISPSRTTSEAISSSTRISALVIEAPTARRSFGDRMRRLTLNQQQTRSAARAKTAASKMARSQRQSNIHEALTLLDFKRLVGDENEKITVVRFHAKWCPACKRTKPLFDRLAREHPNMKFVQVAVDQSNANLVSGLGVPSLPYGHVYHPEEGLAEGLSINKKYFADVAKIVQSYEAGECQLSDSVDSETRVYDAPYARH